jgi:rhamnogalacturonyl hydrolase YesR
MFVLAMARGIRNGWLDSSYRQVVMRGWQGISAKIADDGSVAGICQGTGIGESLEFYLRRKTPVHDPRGLGAVIMAGIEMQQMIDGTGPAR